MGEDNKVKIGKTILSEDDLKFTVEYKGELFTMRYPTPFEIAAIEADIARKLGGFPRESYTGTHIALIEATAYVNQLVVPEDSPSWFKSAWTCYDEGCIGTLYQGYLRFRTKFQERFRDPDKGNSGVGKS